MAIVGNGVWAWLKILCFLSIITPDVLRSMSSSGPQAGSISVRPGWISQDWGTQRHAGQIMVHARSQKSGGTWWPTARWITWRATSSAQRVMGWLRKRFRLSRGCGRMMKIATIPRWPTGKFSVESSRSGPNMLLVRRRLCNKLPMLHNRMTDTNVSGSPNGQVENPAEKRAPGPARDVRRRPDVGQV